MKVLIAQTEKVHYEELKADGPAKATAGGIQITTYVLSADDDRY